MKVDQRIIDMVSVEEGMTRPKSSSFLHRSGSFTTKGSKDKGGTLKKAENDDKDRESGKEDKLLQQFNKNVSNIVNGLNPKSCHKYICRWTLTFQVIVAQAQLVQTAG